MPASVFLLAAGFGTRLRPLTELRPKPMLPICGVPMLDHALALCRAHGMDEVLVNAHYLWQQVAAWAERNGAQLQVELPEILGTGGGLRAAQDQLAQTFVVVNGDILCDVDLGALGRAVPPGGAAMALRPSPDAEEIGPVRASPDGLVRRITNVVPSQQGVPGTHFTGIHAMDRDTLALVPDHGQQCIVRTAYKALVPQGVVASILHTGTWFDVGTPRAYLAANLAVLSGTLNPPADVWARATRDGQGNHRGEDVQLQGSAANSVLGAGCTVPADARLDACVVWEGARVPSGVHQHAIVLSDGRVVQAG